MSDDTAVVLVHGAWHGTWAWDLLIPELGDCRSVAVALPSSGHDPGQLGGFADDVSAVQAAVRGIGGPCVVIAHSYGGAPVTEAVGQLPGVLGLIYIAAFALDIGESAQTVFHSDGIPQWWDVHAEEGYFDVLDPARIFYNDLDPEAAQRWVAQLGHQSLDTVDTMTDAAWRHVPSSYVICERDAAFSPANQEKLASRIGRAHRIDSGHSPFFSRPAELAALIRSDIVEFRMRQQASD